MIEFDHVTVTAGQTVLLDDITFSIDEGDKAVIFGPTGSGKSTVLTTLMGARAPSAGRILVDGTPLTAETITTLRNRVAFIGQEPVLGAANVRDALLLPFTFRANRHAHPDSTALHDALDRVRLPHRILDSDTGVVSGGEKQRIAIARALLLGKHVFLADEITSALDEESTKVILDLFLHSEYTVLAVSHHPAWRQSFGTRIEVADGRIVRIEKTGEDDR
ncbi:MAG: ATP-binding cassette domain-containing protein [Chitinivibrionales bacterium]|nr:ATP-binding cassette domain-containing protein [Chitinivibrionales bacterium]